MICISTYIIVCVYIYRYIGLWIIDRFINHAPPTETRPAGTKHLAHELGRVLAVAERGGGFFHHESSRKTMEKKRTEKLRFKQILG